MADVREQILARLFAVLEGVSGVETCVRNRDQLPADKRPAILLLDGDEEARRDADGRGRSAASPNRIVMRPEIYIALDSRKPKNLLIGEDLNAFRASVLKPVLTDATLQGLCDMFYAGAVNDLAKERTVEGQMGIAIEFTYVLKPQEL